MNLVIVNGVRYEYPDDQSISIDNGKIVIGGNDITPEAEKISVVVTGNI